jgi:hypothetical protein
VISAAVANPASLSAGRRRPHVRHLVGQKNDRTFALAGDRDLPQQRRPIEVDHHFEELNELHDIIERGPDWNTIEGIFIRLNPHRTAYPEDTVEDAAER